MKGHRKRVKRSVHTHTTTRINHKWATHTSTATQ